MYTCTFILISYNLYANYTYNQHAFLFFIVILQITKFGKERYRYSAGNRLFHSPIISIAIFYSLADSRTNLE